MVMVTETKQYRMLVDALQQYEGDTIRIIITQGSNTTSFEMSEILFQEIKNHSQMGNRFWIQGHYRSTLSLNIDDIIKVHHSYFIEEDQWRKDGYEIHLKTGEKIEIDILD
ncbi:hypothetical protein AB1I81_28255 [Bacillus mobilis]|uniref:Uncharacterized protein n=1 Tax=Bacillus mobilis TaxID=2026190 RepID=A0ABV4S1J2_9BACI